MIDMVVEWQKWWNQGHVYSVIVLLAWQSQKGTWWRGKVVVSLPISSAKRWPRDTCLPLIFFAWILVNKDFESLNFWTGDSSFAHKKFCLHLALCLQLLTSSSSTTSNSRENPCPRAVSVKGLPCGQALSLCLPSASRWWCRVGSTKLWSLNILLNSSMCLIILSVWLA